MMENQAWYYTFGEWAHNGDQYGRPIREAAISEDDIVNLRIALETYSDFAELLSNI